jgi:SAM-dependent methyltransferase
MLLTAELIFVCPQCSGTLEADTDALNCRGCPLSYPIRDGVPLLVIDRARARPTPTDPQFDRLVAEAAAAPFSGWNWSWLDGRRVTAPDPHGDLAELYDARAPSLVASSTAVLDLGTSGGERLATYGPFPSVAFATEAYRPNVQLARERLGPMGVQVIWNDNACQNSRGPEPGNRWPQRRLPFADGTFDLVLAQRTAFSPREVARILKPGGLVLTLQGRTEWQGETLADALSATPPEWSIPGQGWFVGHTFFEAGFRVELWEERTTTTTFLDVGAVVYTLLHVPWTIPDFDLDRYRERLYRLDQRIRAEGGFTTRGSGSLIEARKPW